MAEKGHLSWQIHGLAEATWTLSTEGCEVSTDTVTNNMTANAYDQDKCPTTAVLDIREKKLTFIIIYMI